MVLKYKHLYINITINASCISHAQVDQHYVSVTISFTRMCQVYNKQTGLFSLEAYNILIQFKYRL